jgi:endonuclease-3
VLGVEGDVKRIKALQVEASLCKWYGDRPYRPDAYDADIVGAVIATILSQHTSDINSGRAFLSLKSAYPDGWDSVRKAASTELADVIRCGGLAQIKAERIKQVLADIYEQTGRTDLDFLKTWESPAKIIEFLTAFHGVGPKTAACVVLFNLGLPAVPVDTHVHRVARRIGMVPFVASAAKTQDILSALVPGELAYSFHVHLIEHGRKTCKARNPSCGACPVSHMCDAFGGLIPVAI